VCGTFKERAGFHGCQMPERLLERIIRVSSKPGQLVVDPFAGSGSTLVVAKKLGRDCLGFEVSANYAARIRNRLEQTYEGQPLEGAKEPKLSAPKTAEGKQLPTAPRFDWSAGKPERSKIAGGIMEAFIVARDGFPVDRVIADPDLNREFVSVCHRFGLPGDACEWNRRLMNLRKSSHFRGLPRSKRTTFSLKETDRYSFACEIAVQHFHSLGHSLDYLLCDPNLADEFDKYVRKIVNQNLPTLLVRWIALSIRKRAKAVRRISQTVVNAVRLPNRKEMVTQLDHERVPACPGLYWLEDADNSKKLYVGQTLNLNDRLHDQLRSTEFNFWGSPREQLLLRYCAVGADDKQEQRRLPGNQSIWIAKWRPLGNYEKLAAL
jgi:site-specific DNA-methyltransferase (adenine-specific)